jgi:hypothetical protein
MVPKHLTEAIREATQAAYSARHKGLFGHLSPVEDEMPYIRSDEITIEDISGLNAAGGTDGNIYVDVRILGRGTDTIAITLNAFDAAVAKDLLGL